jgi:transposase
MGRPSRFSTEVRERAVRMVREHEHEYGSRWEAIRSIAPKIGCTAQTLHNWIRKTEPVQIAAASEQARLKELEREVAELRRANEILRKASAYFARAELDRRGK